MDRAKFLGASAPAAPAPAPVAEVRYPEREPAAAPEAPAKPRRARKARAEAPEAEDKGKVLRMPGKVPVGDLPRETVAFTVGDALDRARADILSAVERMARMTEAFGAAGVLPAEWAATASQAIDMAREAARALPGFAEAIEAIRTE